MKNAVEKWERLGITPPRDELQVPAVGLATARHAASNVDSVGQPAMVDVGATAATTQLPTEPATVPEMGPVAEAESAPARAQQCDSVEAAKTSSSTAVATSETSRTQTEVSSPRSQFSQRLQRVQETCARLLPIKGRSAETTAPGDQSSRVMRILFHPEAMVVLLLIVACFLAVVILDDRDPANDEVAAAAEIAEAPAAPSKAVPPPAQPAPAQPAAESPSVAVEPPVQAAAPPASVETAPVAAAPIATVQPPTAPAEPPANAVADVPPVAQTPPPAAQPPVAVAPPVQATPVPAGAAPLVQNPTIPPIAANASAPPPVAAVPQPATAAPQQAWNPPRPHSMPPHAAANMPMVIRGRIDAPRQPPAWPATASPVFEAPPTNSRSPVTTAMRPGPRRTLNPYIPSAAATRMPPANVQAYPATAVPELSWPPQYVARRSPQRQTSQPAAQLHGTIEQPLPGTRHELY